MLTPFADGASGHEGIRQLNGRILAIDDELAMLEACEETLSYHGYEVTLSPAPMMESKWHRGCPLTSSSST